MTRCRSNDYHGVHVRCNIVKISKFLQYVMVESLSKVAELRRLFTTRYCMEILPDKSLWGHLTGQSDVSVKCQDNRQIDLLRTDIVLSNVNEQEIVQETKQYKNHEIWQQQTWLLMFFSLDCFRRDGRKLTGMNQQGSQKSTKPMNGKIFYHTGEIFRSWL